MVVLSQSKYSFASLFVIKYANISSGIFGVSLLTIREKHYSSTEVRKTFRKRYFVI